MSDEAARADSEPVRKPGPIVEHWCEHPGCIKWGSFGFANGKEAPRWFCGDHRAAGG